MASDTGRRGRPDPLGPERIEALQPRLPQLDRIALSAGAAHPGIRARDAVHDHLLGQAFGHLLESVHRPFGTVLQRIEQPCRIGQGGLDPADLVDRPRLLALERLGETGGPTRARKAPDPRAAPFEARLDLAQRGIDPAHRGSPIRGQFPADTVDAPARLQQDSADVETGRALRRPPVPVGRLLGAARGGIHGVVARDEGAGHGHGRGQYLLGLPGTHPGAVPPGRGVGTGERFQPPAQVVRGAEEGLAVIPPRLPLPPAIRRPEHRGQPLRPGTLHPAQPPRPAALALAEGTLLARHHHAAEMSARHPRHRDIPRLAPPHERAERAGALPLHAMPQTHPGPALQRGRGDRRPDQRRQLFRRPGHPFRGLGQLRLQPHGMVRVPHGGPQRVQHLGRHPPAVARGGLRALRTFRELLHRPLMRGDPPPQRLEHRLPRIRPVTAPQFAERIVQRGTDPRRDFPVARQRWSRVVAGVRWRTAHSAPSSAAPPTPSPSTTGYQSRSGISPALRNPSRARSVTSLWKTNSKRGSRT